MDAILPVPGERVAGLCPESRLARQNCLMTKQFILLIEDDPDDQELIIRALRKSGIDSEITVAGDGVEALEFLLGTGPHADRDLTVMPALILLDLKLPRLDSLNVLQRVRAHRLTQHLPVMLVTDA